MLPLGRLYAEVGMSLGAGTTLPAPTHGSGALQGLLRSRHRAAGQEAGVQVGDRLGGGAGEQRGVWPVDVLWMCCRLGASDPVAVLEA